jgi:hypothetical protein
MKISIDDAAAIYARMCHARYGARAGRVVRDKIRQLQKRGDASGIDAWSRVAGQLAKVKPDTDWRRIERKKRRNATGGPNAKDH